MGSIQFGSVRFSFGSKYWEISLAKRGGKGRRQDRRRKRLLVVFTGRQYINPTSHIHFLEEEEEEEEEKKKTKENAVLQLLPALYAAEVSRSRSRSGSGP